MKIEEYIRIIESEYRGKATINGFVNEENSKGITKQKEKELYTEVPCLLSFENSPISISNGKYSEVEQRAIIFLSSKYMIPVNATIIVKQDGRTYKFKKTGIPEVYESHQEIVLGSVEIV